MLKKWVTELATASTEVIVMGLLEDEQDKLIPTWEDELDDVGQGHRQFWTEEFSNSRLSVDDSWSLGRRLHRAGTKSWKANSKARKAWARRSQVIDMFSEWDMVGDEW
jgi:hypothetical protein